MQAVEFEAPIENGVVHIPKEYQEIYKIPKAKFVVIYDEVLKDDKVQSQLEEFRKLRSKSNNKVMATLDLITNIDEEMCNDGIL